jgi:hypothetical protein
MAADLKLQVEELEDATTSLLNGEEPRGEQ